MNSDLRKFLIRAFLLSAPMVFAVITYVICDPFRVLRRHDFGDYYDEAAPVELNRDYVSLELFRKNQPERQYDSFIFGSSRSFPFHCDEWAKYIPGARPFHYPAASETIYGISKKLQYLARQGVAVRHALLEVGTGLSGTAPLHDATHRLPYALSGESWLDFQAGYLKAWFTDLYFLKYMDYLATGRLNTFNRGALGIQRGAVHIDPVTNDYYFLAYEKALREDPDAFYRKRQAEFPPHGESRPPCAAPVIMASQRAILDEIHSVFEKLGTDYRILLAPDYRQICLNPADEEVLRSIFGAERVFNFTGVNEFTADRGNFYDSGHIRPEVADKILSAIYRADARSSVP